MFIEPNSTIRLLRNVPLSLNYENTMWFESISNQRDYFIGKTKQGMTFQDYSYIRQHNKIRIGVSADLIYDCNYLMYQNTSFSNKWFYAFITDIEYVNNGVAEISFAFDDLQSWFFDMWLEECFIERQHAEADGITGNLVEENLTLGEYEYDNYEKLNYFNDLKVVIAICDSDMPLGSGEYDNTYSGCRLYAFDPSERTLIDGLLNNYSGKPDSVVLMYMCPSDLIGDVTDDHTIPFDHTAISYRITKTAISPNDSFGNYVPRNRKLYSFPYTYISVNNGSGSSINCRYEYFKNLTPDFLFEGTLTAPVKISCKPRNYKHVESDVITSGALMEECVVVDGYPTCSWNSDAFTRWFTQNAVPNILQSGFAIGLQSFMNSSPALVGASGLLTIANTLKEGYQSSLQADTNRGNFSVGNVNSAHQKNNFYISRVRIREEYARRIDNYFQMYGYAQKIVGIPNIHAREKWTYIKTLGCVCNGNIPTTAKRNIEKLFNNGLRFFTNESYIGNYNQDNNVLSGV